jgi:hypothetical protein
MPSIITTPTIPEPTSPTSADDEIEPLPLLCSSALRPWAYRGERTLDILVREHPDLHLQAMAWLG